MDFGQAAFGQLEDFAETTALHIEYSLDFAKLADVASLAVAVAAAQAAAVAAARQLAVVDWSLMGRVKIVSLEYSAATSAVAALAFELWTAVAELAA